MSADQRGLIRYLLYRARLPAVVRALADAGTPVPRAEVERIGLRRFDDAGPAEVAGLPPRVRAAVIADRKRRVTAALERAVAAGAIAPLGRPPVRKAR